MEYLLASVSIRIQCLHVPDVALFLLPQFFALPIEKEEASAPVETYNNRQFSVAVHVTRHRIINPWPTLGTPPNLTFLIKKSRRDSPALITRQVAISSGCINSYHGDRASFFNGEADTLLKLASRVNEMGALSTHHGDGSAFAIRRPAHTYLRNV